MTTIHCLTLTDRFAFLIDGLCQDVAAEAPRGRVAVAFTVLLWGRLRRMVTRFAAAEAQFRAGALPAAGDAACPADAQHPVAVTRRSAWVVQTIPGAAVWRAGIEELLDDPEMVAMIAGSPQIGRVLRPLCRMLGIKPTAALALPRRRRAAGPEDPGRIVGRRSMHWRLPGRLRLPVAKTGCGSARQKRGYSSAEND